MNDSDFFRNEHSHVFVARVNASDQNRGPFEKVMRAWVNIHDKLVLLIIFLRGWWVFEDFQVNHLFGYLRRKLPAWSVGEGQRVRISHTSWSRRYNHWVRNAVSSVGQQNMVLVEWGRQLKTEDLVAHQSRVTFWDLFVSLDRYLQVVKTLSGPENSHIDCFCILVDLIHFFSTPTVIHLRVLFEDLVVSGIFFSETGK